MEHVLAVFPHPDDETFGKAGTIALYTKAGIPVTLICGTLGQLGRNMGKPFFATRETLPTIREKELRDACAILGIKDLRLLGLRDKTVEFEDPEALADRIETVLRELSPSVVMTYYPEHGVHPDHDGLSRATVHAVKRLPQAQRPVIYGSAVTKNAVEALGSPDIVNDVSEVLEIKLAAMRAHRSQSEAMMEKIERDLQDPKKKEKVEQTLKMERFWIYRT
ncbi:bacillithiol biosynthesis deacetylase BshB2 [Sulfoacidibacillus thermotolerans]|uniref:Bacillithiol biosynthesis deacetylase BshB2 n=1 Tax=Sulfoacidibacillus thermotolerans TaxID=1765684 RepID=A0A2U3D807_SULT2|nr:bacillithiol biosynthesis deacetylase BshB2 [Sulfoacidibacillus thermotolerans]PWI57389.1 bacillithiol biosynthesis deacetylase BshB2 [Sulfoacidibacillus thermotolerans]